MIPASENTMMLICTTCSEVYDFFFSYLVNNSFYFRGERPLKTSQDFFFLTLEFYFCFIQQVLTSHPFYTHQCIHVNPNRPIHHTTPTTPTPAAFPPWCPYVCSLHLCLYFCKPVHLYHFSRFHIYALIYDICFSLSDLLHSV